MITRPSEYKPEYAGKLLEWLNDGWSIAMCAKELKYSRQTLYVWREKHQDFADAWELGATGREAYWHRVCRDVALGDRTIDKSANNAFIMALRNFGNMATKDKDESAAKEMPPVKIILHDNRAGVDEH